MELNVPNISILGKDPDRIHRINANSFQQNALTTVNGWQYAAFYTQDQTEGPCFVNIARRQVLPQSTSVWETLKFIDYEQVIDDGHNTISIGVCRGDGTIHIAFDHHCDQLRFRSSKEGLALNPSQHSWTPSLFTSTKSTLPGLDSTDLMKEVTYPRFLNTNDSLLLTYRIGQAGQGSDILYAYSSETHKYTYLGQYLTGTTNSPYINGIDYRLGRIHISWCYRNFIPPPKEKDAHKQQAGFNGPENNFDLCYAFSDNLGLSWKNSGGKVIARLDDKAEGGNAVENSIMPGAEGAIVFDIPTNSGILNQEAQATDNDGGFWALNREKVNGDESWMAYYRSQSGTWKTHRIKSKSQPTETGSRGSIGVDRKNNVYLILPGNLDSSLDVMRATKAEGYKTFSSIWRDDGYNGEPLVDVQRLEEFDVLSVFTRTDSDANKERSVVVLDFDLKYLEGA